MQIPGPTHGVYMLPSSSTASLPGDVVQFAHALYHTFVDYCKLPTAGRTKLTVPAVGWSPRMSLQQLTCLVSDMGLLAPHGRISQTQLQNIFMGTKPMGSSSLTFGTFLQTMAVISAEVKMTPDALFAAVAALALERPWARQVYPGLDPDGAMPASPTARLQPPVMQLKPTLDHTPERGRPSSARPHTSPAKQPQYSRFHNFPTTSASGAAPRELRAAWAAQPASSTDGHMIAPDGSTIYGAAGIAVPGWAQELINRMLSLETTFVEAAFTAGMAGTGTGSQGTAGAAALVAAAESVLQNPLGGDEHSAGNIFQQGGRKATRDHNKHRHILSLPAPSATSCSTLQDPGESPKHRRCSSPATQHEASSMLSGTTLSDLDELQSRLSAGTAGRQDMKLLKDLLSQMRSMRSAVDKAGNLAEEVRAGMQHLKAAPRKRRPHQQHAVASLEPPQTELPQQALQVAGNHVTPRLQRASTTLSVDSSLTSVDLEHLSSMLAQLSARQAVLEQSLRAKQHEGAGQGVVDAQAEAAATWQAAAARLEAAQADLSSRVSAATTTCGTLSAQVAAVTQMVASAHGTAKQALVASTVSCGNSNGLGPVQAPITDEQPAGYDVLKHRLKKLESIVRAQASAGGQPPSQRADSKLTQLSTPQLSAIKVELLAAVRAEVAAQTAAISIQRLQHSAAIAKDSTMANEQLQERLADMEVAVEGLQPALSALQDMPQLLARLSTLEDELLATKVATTQPLAAEAVEGFMRQLEEVQARHSASCAAQADQATALQQLEARIAVLVEEVAKAEASSAAAADLHTTTFNKLQEELHTLDVRLKDAREVQMGAVDGGAADAEVHDRLRRLEKQMKEVRHAAISSTHTTVEPVADESGQRKSTHDVKLEADMRQLEGVVKQLQAQVTEMQASAAVAAPAPAPRRISTASSRTEHRPMEEISRLDNEVARLTRSMQQLQEQMEKVQMEAAANSGAAASAAAAATATSAAAQPVPARASSSRWHSGEDAEVARVMDMVKQLDAQMKEMQAIMASTAAAGPAAASRRQSLDARSSRSEKSGTSPSPVEERVALLAEQLQQLQATVASASAASGGKRLSNSSSVSKHSKEEAGIQPQLQALQTALAENTCRLEEQLKAAQQLLERKVDANAAETDAAVKDLQSKVRTLRRASMDAKPLPEADPLTPRNAASREVSSVNRQASIIRTSAPPSGAAFTVLNLQVAALEQQLAKVTAGWQEVEEFSSKLAGMDAAFAELQQQLQQVKALQAKQQQGSEGKEGSEKDRSSKQSSTSGRRSSASGKARSVSASSIAAKEAPMANDVATAAAVQSLAERLAEFEQQLAVMQEQVANQKPAPSRSASSASRHQAITTSAASTVSDAADGWLPRVSGLEDDVDTLKDQVQKLVGTAAGMAELTALEARLQHLEHHSHVKPDEPDTRSAKSLSQSTSKASDRQLGPDQLDGLTERLQALEETVLQVKALAQAARSAGKPANKGPDEESDDGGEQNNLSAIALRLEQLEQALASKARASSGGGSDLPATSAADLSSELAAVNARVQELSEALAALQHAHNKPAEIYNNGPAEEAEKGPDEAAEGGTAEDNNGSSDGDDDNEVDGAVSRPATAAASAAGGLPSRPATAAGGTTLESVNSRIDFLEQALTALAVAHQQQQSQQQQEQPAAPLSSSQNVSSIFEEAAAKMSQTGQKHDVQKQLTALQLQIGQVDELKEQVSAVELQLNRLREAVTEDLKQRANAAAAAAAAPIATAQGSEQQNESHEEVMQHMTTLATEIQRLRARMDDIDSGAGAAQAIKDVQSDVTALRELVEASVRTMGRGGADDGLQKKTDDLAAAMVMINERLSQRVTKLEAQLQDGGGPMLGNTYPPAGPSSFGMSTAPPAPPPPMHMPAPDRPPPAPVALWPGTPVRSNTVDSRPGSSTRDLDSNAAELLRHKSARDKVAALVADKRHEAAMREQRLKDDEERVKHQRAAAAAARSRSEPNAGDDMYSPTRTALANAARSLAADNMDDIFGRSAGAGSHLMTDMYNGAQSMDGAYGGGGGGKQVSFGGAVAPIQPLGRNTSINNRNSDQKLTLDAPRNPMMGGMMNISPARLAAMQQSQQNAMMAMARQQQQASQMRRL